ncbi:MAG: PEGA domain-containing protein [Myxococcales bacterium]|nr:PEGA domain-containing protein [Myxococcales bacterium]
MHLPSKPPTYRARPIARLFSLTVLAMGLLGPCAARAQSTPTDPATASAELKRQGGAAMDRLDFAAAEEAYRKAVELTPTDTTLHYNLGKVHQARGNYPAAVDELEIFLRDASPELRAKVPRILEVVAELRARVATVSLVCTVDEPAALIELGGVQVSRGCRTAGSMIRVSIPHGNPQTTLKIVSASHRAQDTALLLKSGGPLPVRVDLVPKATSGTLRLRTEPMGATILVDGQARGNPPIELYLAPGSHEVVAKLEAYKDATVPVIIELGQTKDLVVPLSKPEPVTKKWWFWTGVVTVVAAAVIVPIAIATAPEPEVDAGSLGKVVAPLARF